jgi:hypothetical protein
MVDDHPIDALPLRWQNLCVRAGSVVDRDQKMRATR